MGMCLSHSATLKAVDTMGENHDQEVFHWAQELESAIPQTGLEVCLTHCTRILRNRGDAPMRSYQQHVR